MRVKHLKFHPRITNRILSRENTRLEFKESYNWQTKSRYAKIMASFANRSGGVIMFGITDKPRILIGLQNNNFEDTDGATISQYLNSAFSPEISYEKIAEKVNGKIIGLLIVHESSQKPVVCLKTDKDIKEAEIYYRYYGSTDKIKYPELRRLMEEIKEKERKIWQEHLEKISKIDPSEAAILDISSQKINGLGAPIVIDQKLASKLKFINEGQFHKKGAPTLKLIGDVKPVLLAPYKTRRIDKKIATKVQITEDPTAPMVKITEENLLAEYSLTYPTLTAELQKRYTDFLRNKKFHKLMRAFKKNPSLSRTRRLDPRNLKSSSKEFYHSRITKEFDIHYTKKRVKQ